MRYFFSRRAGETLAYAIEIVQRRRRDPKTSVMHGLDTAFPFSPGLSLSCIDQVIGDIALCGFLPVFSLKLHIDRQGNPMQQEPATLCRQRQAPHLPLEKRRKWSKRCCVRPRTLRGDEQS